MPKAKVKGFFSLFVNSKPASSVIFLVTIIFVPCYLVGTSHAEGMAKRDTKHSVSSAAEGPGEWLTVRMRVTAYCPCPKCCDRYSDGVTACGHKIRSGDFFVAADKKYPFGTEVIIPGYKSSEAVKVLDRGGVIRGNRLDVFFHTHQEALNWGVRNLEVKIRHK